MKKLYIVGNWKAQKIREEAHDWLKAFIENTSINIFEGKEIVLCPSFTLLPHLHTWITNHHIPLKLGAQNISPFPEGPYTGEVSGRQIKEFADFVITGHSERRTHFNETDELIEKKIEMSLQARLIPVLCVQDETARIPAGVDLVAYEPVFAIGTGNPDTPENAERVAVAIKERNPHVNNVIYGGSVNAENVHSFTSQEHIDGVLPGKASLDAQEFIQIIKHA